MHLAHPLLDKVDKIVINLGFLGVNEELGHISDLIHDEHGLVAVTAGNNLVHILKIGQ